MWPGGRPGAGAALAGGGGAALAGGGGAGGSGAGLGRVVGRVVARAVLVLVAGHVVVVGRVGRQRRHAEGAGHEQARLQKVVREEGKGQGPRAPRLGLV